MIIYFHLCVIFNFWRYALASTAGKQEYAAYIVDPCRSLVGRCCLPLSKPVLKAPMVSALETLLS